MGYTMPPPDPLNALTGLLRGKNRPRRIRLAFAPLECLFFGAAFADAVKRLAGFCVKDLPACWREASLMQVLGRLRHLHSEGGCEGRARVRLFFGEPEVALP